MMYLLIFYDTISLMCVWCSLCVLSALWEEDQSHSVQFNTHIDKTVPFHLLCVQCNTHR